jgi:hypothetical protein
MSALTAPSSQSAQLPRSSPSTTLRTLMDARRAAGARFTLDEAVATIVPLCLDLKEHHDRGERVYVHPSCVAPAPDGLAKLALKLAVVPTNPRDRACMAPQLQQTLAPGAARATELLLEKALVGDPAHRPDDLAALASALYHVAPAKSIHPPEVDEGTLDHTGEFDVDVKLSLMPPEAPAGVAMPRSPGLPRDLDPFAPPLSSAPSRSGRSSPPSRSNPRSSARWSRRTRRSSASRRRRRPARSRSRRSRS